MGKRKKKPATRKTTAAKRAKAAEEQPSSSKDEEENVAIPEDIVPPTEEEKDCQNEEPISTISSNSKDDAPAVVTEVIAGISEDIVSNEESLVPGEPGEFIFAPIISQPEDGSSCSSSSRSTIDVNVLDSSRSASSSKSMGDKVVSLLSAIVHGPAKKENGSGDGEIAPRSIEVIDVDELPDTPCSSIGDDVIEITPGNSSRSSRSNSPEVIVNRQVVDLTGSGEVEDTPTPSTPMEPVPVTEDDETMEGESEVFLSLWSTYKKERDKRHTALIPHPVSQCKCSTTNVVSPSLQNFKISIVKDQFRSSKSTSKSSAESSKCEKPPASAATASPPKPTDEGECSTRQKLHCPICMDDFSLIVKDRRLMSTSCGHVFCDVCLKAAIDSQKRCPTCRKKQSMKNLHPIFL